MKTTEKQQMHRYYHRQTDRLIGPGSFLFFSAMAEDVSDHNHGLSLAGEKTQQIGSYRLVAYSVVVLATSGLGVLRSHAVSKHGRVLWSQGMGRERSRCDSVMKYHSLAKTPGRNISEPPGSGLSPRS